MGRPPKHRLRCLSPEEAQDLESISRARSAPSEAVLRARILMAVASSMNHTQAAHSVGRKSNDAVSMLVTRFNEEGLEALIPPFFIIYPSTFRRWAYAMVEKWATALLPKT